MSVFAFKKPIKSAVAIRRDRINALCDELGIDAHVSGSMTVSEWTAVVEKITLAMLEAEAARRK